MPQNIYPLINESGMSILGIIYTIHICDFGSAEAEYRINEFCYVMLEHHFVLWVAHESDPLRKHGIRNKPVSPITVSIRI